MKKNTFQLIEYIPLQQGLRLQMKHSHHHEVLIEYIPLQQGLRHTIKSNIRHLIDSLSIFHYNKD